MTTTTPVDALLADIKQGGTYTLMPLVNAYLADQPIASQMLKNLWDIGRFVDNNGRLMPLTKAALAALLETPEWRDHPVVIEALKLKKPERSVDEDLLDEIEKQIRLKSYAPNDAASLWLAYYTDQPARFHSTTFDDCIDDDNKLKSFVIAAMNRMVKEGRAPSREALGLTPVHEVRIQFPTAEAATAFLAKWREDLGNRLATATKRLLGTGA